MAVSMTGAHGCRYPSVAVASQSGRCTIKNSFAPSPSTSKPATVRIGGQWAELQGARDWDGLLSPLDGTLRSEIVRYGEFVRAAYASFDFDGRSPAYGSCRFPSRSLLRRSGLPRTGYRVTRLLHAASGSAPSWLSCSSSYIGYVAVCDDEEEIERLGRRDVVVAYRGTATRGEWVDNFQSALTRLPTTVPPAAGAGGESMVETGFWKLFTTPGKAHHSLQQQVRGEVQAVIRAYGGKNKPPLSVTVTGHSLGAALAVLTAHDITTAVREHCQDGAAAPPMVTAVSFGGPRVGNEAFRRSLEEGGGKVLRVVNSSDMVTKLPGFPIDGGRRGEEPAARVPRWLAAKMGWAYSDVGRELRLCSQEATNVVASHDLDLYLKLVAGCTD